MSRFCIKLHGIISPIDRSTRSASGRMEQKKKDEQQLDYEFYVLDFTPARFPKLVNLDDLVHTPTIYKHDKLRIRRKTKEAEWGVFKHE
ncbi:hypothetical protein GWI33_002446 [Rhynchophorus ferrugineus]|uniref:Uncharacterized protein n=1 Tax=Rhynchophorus ferrugineus TaxID=354439 RepID=A0A834ITR7_RHYFE|nr:hypothetical protein GWI33_002446 [Rhynchophorus ferrugineus]